MISFLANTKNITFFLKLSQCFICSVLTVHITFSNTLVIYVQIGHYTDYKCTSSPRLIFIYIPEPSSVQFSSVTQSCLTLCDPMNCSMPGFPVHHRLLELTQTHVHRVSDAMQPSHSLLSPSPPAFDLS